VTARTRRHPRDAFEEAPPFNTDAIRHTALFKDGGRFTDHVRQVEQDAARLQHRLIARLKAFVSETTAFSAAA
jgi:hypothetical protein